MVVYSQIEYYPVMRTNESILNTILWVNLKLSIKQKKPDTKSTKMSEINLCVRSQDSGYF